MRDPRVPIGCLGHGCSSCQRPPVRFVSGQCGSDLTIQTSPQTISSWLQSTNSAIVVSAVKLKLSVVLNPLSKKAMPSSTFDAMARDSRVETGLYYL